MGGGLTDYLAESMVHACGLQAPVQPPRAAHQQGDQQIPQGGRQEGS